MFIEPEISQNVPVQFPDLTSFVVELWAKIETTFLLFKTIFVRIILITSLNHTLPQAPYTVFLVKLLSLKPYLTLDYLNLCGCLLWSSAWLHVGLILLPASIQSNFRRESFFHLYCHQCTTSLTYYQVSQHKIRKSKR